MIRRSKRIENVLVLMRVLTLQEWFDKVAVTGMDQFASIYHAMRTRGIRGSCLIGSDMFKLLTF